MINGFLELTWKIAKGQICEVRTANLQHDAIFGEAELRLMTKELLMV
jgi:hypothetical protein